MYWKTRATVFQKQLLDLCLPLPKTPWGLSLQCQLSVSFFKSNAIFILSLEPKTDRTKKMSDVERLGQIKLSIGKRRNDNSDNMALSEVMILSKILYPLGSLHSFWGTHSHCTDTIPLLPDHHIIKGML